MIPCRLFLFVCRLVCYAMIYKFFLGLTFVSVRHYCVSLFEYHYRLKPIITTLQNTFIFSNGTLEYFVTLQIVMRSINFTISISYNISCRSSKNMKTSIIFAIRCMLFLCWSLIVLCLESVLHVSRCNYAINKNGQG